MPLPMIPTPPLPHPLAPPLPIGSDSSCSRMLSPGMLWAMASTAMAAASGVAPSTVLRRSIWGQTKEENQLAGQCLARPSSKNLQQEVQEYQIMKRETGGMVSSLIRDSPGMSIGSRDSVVQCTQEERVVHTRAHSRGRRC